MNKKLTLIAAFIVLGVLVTTAAASYYKYSQVVTVTITGDYSLSLATSSVDGHSITLVAILKTPTNDPVINATVYFYKTDINGTVRTSIGYNRTDTSGIAVYRYTVTDGGTYYFQAGYEVK